MVAILYTLILIANLLTALTGDPYAVYCGGPTNAPCHIERDDPNFEDERAAAGCAGEAE